MPSFFHFDRKSYHIAKKAHHQFVCIGWTTLIGLGIWAHFATIEQVVKAQGRVVQSEDNPVVQHLEGGIVTDILVSEGDYVRKQQVLMKVANSFSHAEKEKVELELHAEELRAIRLDAEAGGLDLPAFPETLTSKIPEAAANERELHRKRRILLEDRLAILQEQIAQASFNISDKSTQRVNKEKQAALLEERLQNMEDLVEIGAVSRNEILQMKSDLQQIRTRIDELRFQIPATKAALSEAKKRRSEAMLEFQTEAKEELGKTRLRISALKASLAAMRDRSLRTEVRAPSSGIIKKLLIPTIGGVVMPGGEIVEIVPVDSSIVVEAKLSPKDRAKVWNDLPALIKISAYEYTVYGALHGSVRDISPDAFQDESGSIFFRVRLRTENNGLGPDRPVIAGMMADIDIVTGKRSVLSYILRPLNRARKEALRV